MLNSELLPALLPADRGGFHRAPEPLNPTQSTVSSRSSGLSPRPNCSSCEIVGQFCMDGPHDLGGKIASDLALHHGVVGIEIGRAPL